MTQHNVWPIVAGNMYFKWAKQEVARKTGIFQLFETEVYHRY